MWSAVVPALILSLLWLIGITLAFLFLPESLISKILARFNHPLLLLMLAALIVRIIPMLLLPVGAAYDVESFRLVGEALLKGEEVYTSAAAGRHPYLPLQMALVAASTYLSRLTPLPFVVWLKLPAVLADLLVSLVIYKIFQKWGKSAAASLTWALLYALNPISALVSAYHGQFDAIPVLLLLLAWYSFHFGRRTGRSAVLLGFAILNKTWPIVFLPVAFIRLPNYRQRFGYVLLALSIPILFTTTYILWFDADPTPILRRTLTHAGVPGYWGVSTLIHLPGGLIFNPDQILQLLLPLQRALLLLAGLVVLWWTRRQDALNALLTIILTVFTLMLGMGLQWLLWPIAFAALAREERWLKWYTIMGTFMMLVHLYGLHLYPSFNQLLDPQTATAILRLVSLPVWVTILLWTISRLRHERLKTSEVHQRNMNHS